MSTHIQNLIKFHLFVHKILSGNKLSTIAKDHNSVVNLQKMTCNNPNLDLVMINAYAKFYKFHQFFHKILSGNKSLTTTKGHNHVVKLRKLTCDNHNKDLVKVNIYANFGLIQFIFKLVATLKKFCGRHHDLVNPYNMAVSRIVSDVFASDAP